MKIFKVKFNIGLLDQLRNAIPSMELSLLRNFILDKTIPIKYGKTLQKKSLKSLTRQIIAMNAKQDALIKVRG